jgi:hypothetical protein
MTRPDDNIQEINLFGMMMASPRFISQFDAIAISNGLIHHLRNLIDPDLVLAGFRGLKTRDSGCRWCRPMLEWSPEIVCRTNLF